MRIQVDPNTESSGFGYTEAGQYRLRVVSVNVAQGPKAPYLHWEFEYADPNVQTTDGKGRPGHIFENTTLKQGENAQFRLRQLIDALGLEWKDFDTEETIGMEFDAQVGIEEYQGVMRNVIAKFIPVKK